MVAGQLLRVIRLVIITSEDNVLVIACASVLVQHPDGHRRPNLTVDAMSRHATYINGTY